MSRTRYRALLLRVPGLEGVDAVGLATDGAGRLATVAEAASVRQALLLLLATRPGERVNRPDYGCHLWRMAFAPNDDTTAGLAMHYVSRAVEQWERRVDVLGVDAGPDPGDPGLLEVTLRYRIRATQTDDELVVAVPLAGDRPSTGAAPASRPTGGPR